MIYIQIGVTVYLIAGAYFVWSYMDGRRKTDDHVLFDDALDIIVFAVLSIAWLPIVVVSCFVWVLRLFKRPFVS